MASFKELEKLGIIGLFFQCVYGEERPDCPLKEVRKLDKEQFNKYIELMDDEQVKELCELHNVCSNKRKQEIEK